MSHDDIADFTALYLRKKGYPLSLSNIKTANHGEQPDVLGVSLNGASIVCEVKTSKSDFLADSKKPWRSKGNGMGDFRAYVTPKGLLKVDEVPYGWQLWELHGSKRPFIKIIKGLALVKDTSGPWVTTRKEYRNMTEQEYNAFRVNLADKSCRSELIMAVEVMRRAVEDGVDLNRYANRYQMTAGRPTNYKLKGNVK